MNQGIENIRKKGSRIVAEGAHMLPAASLMKAAGVIESLDDLKKPFVTIVNSFTNQIPGHAHLDKLGAVLREELKALGFNVWYANVGAAMVLEHSEFTPERLVGMICNVINNPQLRKRMQTAGTAVGRPNAADEVLRTLHSCACTQVTSDAVEALRPERTVKEHM